MSGFANSIIGGMSKLIRAAIQSPNYVLHTLGWSINKDGSAEFNQLSIYGGTIVGPNYTIDSQGIYFFDNSGFLVAQWQPSTGIQFYTPGGGGHLITSISEQNTTDSFGNTIPQGLVVGLNNGSQILISQVGSNEQITWNMNNAGFTNPAAFAAPVGGHTYANLVLSGPATTVTGHKDNVFLAFFSSDGTSSSANLEFSYTDTTGSSHEYAYLDASGLNILSGSINATKPGTGTPASPAVAESWHALPLSGWTVSTGGYHASYRITAQGDLELSGRITTTGTSTTLTTALPSGYFQATSPFLSSPVVSLLSGGVTAGQSPRIAISNTGVLSVAGITVNSGTTLSLDGVIFPVSAG